MDYSKHYNAKETPAMVPTPGKNEVQNNAGGFVFEVSPWALLDRFLILGSESGTYYVGEQKLTIENATNVQKVIGLDGVRVVNRIVEISDAGRAPKNDPALFALAMAAKMGNPETRRAAYEALPKVARIGTHLFHFVQFVEAFGGWGRSLKRAVAKWYNDKDPEKLTTQMIKYQSRDGWSHRDLLRLSHPVAPTPDHNALYDYVTNGADVLNDRPRLAQAAAFEKIKTYESAQDVIQCVKDFNLPRECVPTKFLNDVNVWKSMLPTMGLEALIRNLAKMTAIDVLKPMSDEVKFVVDRFYNEEDIKKARLHPIKILAALITYQSGHGVRGSLTWSPVPQIVDALDACFYKSFKFVEPTDKRYLLGLDVSGSMEWSSISGVEGLTPRIGSAAMAMITAATESKCMIGAFAAAKGRANRGYSSIHNYKGADDPDDGFMSLDLSPRKRLDDVIKHVKGLDMGATDCSLPMLWALKHRIPVDAFVIYTDSESWVGKMKPFQALEKYRREMNIDAKAIAVGMVANKFSVFDSSDGTALDVVGFDTSTPSLINEFVK